jgi:putative glutamine amidotransferase
MAASRPTIGICAGVHRSQWGAWNVPADISPRQYVDAVQRAGGAAILLPVDDGWTEDPAGAIDLLDGLVLAGGVDVDPATYGEQPHEETVGIQAGRDACELALLACARERKMPVLGICRGMQLLNIAGGGTLVQHVPDVFTGVHRVTPGSFEGSEHPVALTPGSLIERIIGAERINLNSHHHQAVGRLGEGLTMTAVSAEDELPEAIESSSEPFVLGVQWHPEADPDDRVIGALVDAVRAKL